MLDSMESNFIDYLSGKFSAELMTNEVKKLHKKRRNRLITLAEKIVKLNNEIESEINTQLKNSSPELPAEITIFINSIEQ